MASDIHSVLVGEVWRKAGMVAKASGSPITSGTVNYYLKALTGANAGKWYKNSDQTWAVAETANAMTHQADGLWTITLTDIPGSHVFLDGILYLEYAKESTDLHVAGEGRLLRGCAVKQPATVASGDDADLADLLDGGGDKTITLKRLVISNDTADAALRIVNSVGSAVVLDGYGAGLEVYGETGSAIFVLASGSYPTVQIQQSTSTVGGILIQTTDGDAIRTIVGSGDVFPSAAAETAVAITGAASGGTAGTMGGDVYIAARRAMSVTSIPSPVDYNAISARTIAIKQYARFGPYSFPATGQSGASHAFMVYESGSTTALWTLTTADGDITASTSAVAVDDHAVNAHTASAGRWKWLLRNTTTKEDVSWGDLIIEPAPPGP